MNERLESVRVGLSSGYLCKEQCSDVVEYPRLKQTSFSTWLAFGTSRLADFSFVLLDSPPDSFARV